MPVTDGNSLPYPAPTGGPLGDQQMQALALAVDDALVGVQNAVAELGGQTGPQLSESLPSDPADGQIAYFHAADAGDYAVVWMMRWTDALGIWQAVGAVPASAREDGTVTRASGSGNYDDGTGGAGPVIHIPGGYSGTVVVRIECRIQSGASGESAKASWRIGSDTPVDTNAIICDGTNGTVGVRTSGQITVTGGDTLTMKYWRTSSGTSTYGRRTIQVYPLTAEAV